MKILKWKNKQGNCNDIKWSSFEKISKMSVFDHNDKEKREMAENKPIIIMSNWTET